MILPLELGEFQPGIASTSTMMRSVKILSLNVRFGVRNEVKMVPNFLRCFPNAERLQILVFVINPCSACICTDFLLLVAGCDRLEYAIRMVGLACSSVYV